MKIKLTKKQLEEIKKELRKEMEAEKKEVSIRPNIGDRYCFFRGGCIEEGCYECQSSDPIYKDASQVIKDCESDLKIIFGIK